MERPPHRIVLRSGEYFGPALPALEEDRIMIGSIAVAALLLFASATAFAQDLSSQQRGSPAEQKACKNDAAKFCRAVLSAGEEPIYQCLREERARISAACRKVVESNTFQ
jgi:Cysteine rich repeat